MNPSTAAQKTRTGDEAVFSSSFYQPYAVAVQTVFVLLCALRDDRRAAGEDPGVEALTFRLKTPASIGGKLRRKGLPVTPAAAGSALHDIAGLRVVLSYAFAPHFGMMAIWLAIPAGWLIADIVGFVAMGRRGLMRSASNRTGKSAC